MGTLVSICKTRHVWHCKVIAEKGLERANTFLFYFLSPGFYSRECRGSFLQIFTKTQFLPLFVEQISLI